MTDPLGDYAAPLDASVDALSDVLDLIHLQGGELTAVRAAAGRQVCHHEPTRTAGRLGDLSEMAHAGTVPLLLAAF